MQSLQHKSVIYSIKDLVKQGVIVGVDQTIKYGGYPTGRPVKQNSKVIIIDLIGLQFQKDYNTGRLVLIGKDIPKGILDNLIFKNIVGEKKLCFESASSDHSGRYISIGKNYFDSYAYKKFVANDIFLAGYAISKVTSDAVNFKFLKYGTGYFAGDYQHILEDCIYDGIADGLERLFQSRLIKSIGCVELPFYREHSEIKRICDKYGVQCIFSFDDALKQTHPELITATTNCADPHAMTGNEMGYHSVDATIASNIKGKAYKFSPVINVNMKAIYMSVTKHQETNVFESPMAK